MKKIANLLFCLLFLTDYLTMVSASELGRMRMILEITVNSSYKCKNLNEWISHLPVKKAVQLNLKNWFRRQQMLNQPIPFIEFNKDLGEISWQESGVKTPMTFKILSMQPLSFEWNGLIANIEYSNTDLDYLLKQLQKMQGAKGALGLHSILIPHAEAKGFFDNKFMIPLLILNVFSLGSAAFDIKKIWDKAETAESKYNEESKAIAGVTERIQQNRENKIYPYTVMGVSCHKTIGNGKTNPLAEPGQEGFTTYGINNISLTPKGKSFGESDVQIRYADHNKNPEITEIRLKRKPNSKDSKNLYENDCLIFSAAIKNAENRFLEKCTNEAFPGKNIKNLDDFYKALGIFKLKDYESMSATEPGCRQINSWVVGGPTVITEKPKNPTSQK